MGVSYRRAPQQRCEHQWKYVRNRLLGHILGYLIGLQWHLGSMSLSYKSMVVAGVSASIATSISRHTSRSSRRSSFEKIFPG